MTLADEDTQSNIDAYVGKYAKCVEYDNVADVAESWVQWRSDFQSGSRVEKGVMNLFLSISLAYNLISCRKNAKNTQILKIANLAPS